MSTLTHPARITVDLGEDEYNMLKVTAAMAGRGTTISSIVRQLVHDWVEDQENTADLAAVRARLTSAQSTTPHAEVVDRLRAHRTEAR